MEFHSCIVVEVFHTRHWCGPGVRLHTRQVAARQSGRGSARRPDAHESGLQIRTHPNGTVSTKPTGTWLLSVRAMTLLCTISTGRTAQGALSPCHLFPLLQHIPFRISRGVQRVQRHCSSSPCCCAPHPQTAERKGRRLCDCLGTLTPHPARCTVSCRNRARSKETNLIEKHIHG